MVDEEQQAAILRQSTGYAGRQLLQRGHRISLDQTSLVTRSISTGEAVLVDDVKLDPNFLANPLLPDTRSELVVPLKREGKVIGVLDTQDRTPGRFGPSTIALFQTMADQVTILFENSELLERVTDQTQTMTLFTNQLRTAADIARRLGTILDPERLLSEVVELIQSRFGLYHAHIYLLDESTGQLKLATGSGEVGRVLRDRGHVIPLDAEKSLVARAARSRGTVLVGDTTLESDYMPNPLLPQTRSELAIPMVVGEKVLGVLDLQDDQPNRFTEAERDTFSTLTGLVATSLQNADLFEAQRSAEQAVRESQQRLSLLVQQSPMAVIEWNTDFEVVAWNEAAEQIFGYSSQEAIGHHAAGLIVPEEARDIVNEIWQGLLTQTGGSRSTNDNFTKDGRTITCEWYNSPLVGGDGNVLGIASLVADISERQRAQAEIQKRATELQTVAEVGTAAATILEPEALLFQVVELTKSNFNLYHAHIYLADNTGKTLQLAAGAGEAGKQMVAQGWSIPADSEASLVARAFRTRQGAIVNDVQAAPDFLPNPLLPNTRAELAIPLIVGDRVLGVLDVQSDQVDHFTQQDVIIQTTLAAQIATALDNARLFRETQGVANELRQIDGLKSEFLANMSHELRTPLNSIIGYTQLLLMDLEGEIQEDSYQDMQAIETNSKHLLSLINDILDLAKIEAGRLELNKEPLEVDLLLDAARNNNAGLFIDSPLTFNVATEAGLPKIQADHIRITQVLNNLISNASKFTEEGGVTVRAFKENGNVCIAITDTGIGISQEDLDTIFERFRQVDGSFTRRAEGTGLGLPITRHLAEMHGGTLDVHSILGEGSTFTVRLPIHTEEVIAAHT